jgi:hypothetical protein
MSDVMTSVVPLYYTRVFTVVPFEDCKGTSVLYTVVHDTLSRR